ncbi:hypothetical protein [Pseudomonas helleri]|uniref:hypothetical protein n=1 Tax=Pseudomonas helleri TaxID=1608996 RepID=UPI002432EAAE|nr:hypothetical protein [Pseudomonas helleri]
MNVSIADLIFLAFSLLIFGGIFMCVGASLHMAYTQMDLMLAHLKKSSAIRPHIPLKNGGPWGMLLLVGWIAGVVTFPGFYLKRGEVSIEELDAFPVRLKRKLALIKWSSIVLLAAMILLFSFRKSGLLK